MSRISVVLFYDENGIADEYFGYYLNGLIEVSSKIVVVCNGFLTDESQKMIENYTADVYCRENIGFDAWGYRSALIEYLGWDLLYEYDELILTNYTLFGPFYPFSRVFDAMEKREFKCDCWGMFRNSKIPNVSKINKIPIKWGFMPESMTSNFWVIRSRLLRSTEFRKFYENLPPIKTYLESSVYYEHAFAIMINESGFVFDTFEASGKNGIIPNCFNYAATHLLSVESVPIFRRRKLFRDASENLYNYDDDDSRKALSYIERNTSYDTNLIWNNLLRTANQYDIFRALQLNYVLSGRLYDSKNEINVKIAVVFYVGSINEAVDWKVYINSLPKHTHIYVYTENNETKNWILQQLCQNKVKFELREAPVGRDVGVLIEFIRNRNLYKYICFINTYFTKKYDWRVTGDVRLKRSMDGVLENAEYTLSLLQLFEDNPRLGMVSAPLPYHGDFFKKHKRDWENDFTEVKKIVEEYGFSVPLDVKKTPVRMDGRIMWFRQEALRAFSEINLEFPNDDKGSLYRFINLFDWVYPLVVQSAGFFPAYAESTEMARTDISNYSYLLYDTPENKNLDSKSEINNALKTLLKAKIKSLLPSWLGKIMRKIYRFIRNRHKRLATKLI